MFYKKRARLKEIIESCTQEFRPARELPYKNYWGVSLKVEDLPCESKSDKKTAKIDCGFIIVGINQEIAMKNKKELEIILEEYFQKHLIHGPLFTEFSLILDGDQNLALRLFALGESLEFWRIVTPERLKLKEKEAEIMLSNGIVFIQGYKSQYSW